MIATTKPTIPEVIDRFRAYHDRPENGAWGPYLHCILDDGNTEDVFVRLSLENAERDGATEEVELLRLLSRMSRTQRAKIGRLA